MKTRLAFVVFVLLVAAAAGFEAGRANATTPTRPAAERGESALLHRTSEQPTVVAFASIADGITNIATASFHDTYRLLKAASPAQLDAWGKELEAMTVPPRRRAAITAFFKALMQVDAGEAKRLMLAFGEENRWTALFAIKGAAPSRAMPQVMETLLAVGPEGLAGCSYDYIYDAINEWSRTDPLAVKQFIDEHPQSTLDRYASTLVRNWAAYDPDAARELAVQAIAAAQSDVTHSDPEHATRTAHGIVSDWLQGFLEHDRTAAIDYVLTNSSENAVAAATPTIAAVLYRDSPDDARAFIMHLPDQQRAEAIAAAAWQVDVHGQGDADDAVRSPEFVADWMLRFPDEAWRQGIEPVLGAWGAKNQQALFAWMSSLPAAARQRVIESYPVGLSAETVEEELAGVMSIADSGMRDQLLERVMGGAANARSKVLAVLAAGHLPEAQKQYLSSLIPEDGYEMPPQLDEE